MLPRTWISKTDKLVIESKQLSGEGKGKEALGKVEEAKNLVKKIGGVMVTFVQGSEADGKKFVETWWADEVKKDKDLRKAKLEAVFVKAVPKITAAAIGAAAGIASAVLTAGTALPIAAASVGGGITVITTSVTSLQAAFQGFDKAYDSLELALRKAQKDLEKLAVKGQKPDKGKLDKIKAFFSSSPVKDLEKALEIFKIKVREAETKMDKYVKEMQGLQPKFLDLGEKASKAKNKHAEEQAKKAWERFEYVSKKQSLLRKNIDDAKKVAEAAAQLVIEAKSGKYEAFGGAALGKIGDAAPVLQDMVSIAMNTESLVKAIK